MSNKKVGRPVLPESLKRDSYFRIRMNKFELQDYLSTIHALELSSPTLLSSGKKMNDKDFVRMCFKYHNIILEYFEAAGEIRSESSDPIAKVLSKIN